MALALHARQSTQSASTRKVEQQSLGIIFAVMSYGNALKVIFADELSKPFVAQTASHHLYALARTSHFL